MKNEHLSNDDKNDKDESHSADEADKDPKHGKAIGIDLGTTNSVVSYVEKGKIRTLRIRNREIIPSAIFFDTPDKIFYGRIAMLKGMESPKSSVRLFKRRLHDKEEKFQLKYNQTPPSAEPEGRTFVIDTNAFLDEPDILTQFSPSDKIVVSIKVIDELSYRKSQLETEYAASIALKNIEGNKNRLVFLDSDSKLLPDDLDKRINDNLILSIALKLSAESPVVLTSDKDFQLKCSHLKIAYISLKDFVALPDNSFHTVEESFTLSGEEASALFLSYLKGEAEKQIGPVSYAAVTYPANFNHVEIEATKNAALKAGFKEIKLLKEPTAAAIAYGLDNEVDRKILVYDFGGGTFDVSIIESKGQGAFEVLQTGGDSKLGGEELTRDLIHHVYDELEEELDLSMYSEQESGLHPEVYLQNEMAIYRQADLAKEALSEFEETDISAMILLGEGGQKSFNKNYLRSEFEDLIRPRIKRTLEALNDTLNAADIKADDIDIVVLAGGSSLIPIIQDRVEKYFGHLPNTEKNTATVISQGAAIIASTEWDTEEDGIQEKISYYEKTVADFGVAVTSRNFDCLIKHTTELPVRVKKDYSPEVDNQKNLKIAVFRRDRYHPNASRTFDDGIDFVDQIYISNIPSMQIHEATIWVTFELTKEDILQVSVEVHDIDKNMIQSAGLLVEKSSLS